MKATHTKNQSGQKAKPKAGEVYFSGGEYWLILDEFSAFYLKTEKIERLDSLYFLESERLAKGTLVTLEAQ